MGGPRTLPGAPGSATVATDSSVCPSGHRCHVEGKGIVKFGTNFKQSKVRRLANNAVVLVNNDGKRVGSGTVIDSGKGNSQATIGEAGLVPAAVVLCASHTLDTVTVTDLEVWLPYRLKSPNAPGSSWEKVNDAAKWNPSAPLFSDYGKGRVTKQLEKGAYNYDYALLFVEFSLLSFGVAKPEGAMGRTISDEVLLLGHPYKTTYDCEPTQGSAGKKIADRAKFAPGDSTDYYAMAYLSAKSGSSGGGVYNTSGELVGVLKGRTASGETAFLNLGAVVDAKIKGTDLLQKFMAGTKYLINV